MMFNATIMVGPQGATLRLRFRTEEARTIALDAFKTTGMVHDDLGQSFDMCSGVVHGIVCTSDESDAELSLANEFVQMHGAALVERLKTDDPAFRAHVIKRQRDMQRAQGMPAGAHLLPLN